MTKIEEEKSEVGAKQKEKELKKNCDSGKWSLSSSFYSSVSSSLSAISEVSCISSMIQSMKSNQKPPE